MGLCRVLPRHRCCVASPPLPAKGDKLDTTAVPPSLAGRSEDIGQRASWGQTLAQRCPSDLPLAVYFLPKWLKVSHGG